MLVGLDRRLEVGSWRSLWKGLTESENWRDMIYEQISKLNSRCRCTRAHYHAVSSLLCKGFWSGWVLAIVYRGRKSVSAWDEDTISRSIVQCRMFVK